MDPTDLRGIPFFDSKNDSAIWVPPAFLPDGKEEKGTDYRPTFDYIEANLPMTTMLLYFTDGEGSYPRFSPNYEVLWALSRKAKVPFGGGLVIFS